jgi:hypothetical protein
MSPILELQAFFREAEKKETESEKYKERERKIKRVRNIKRERKMKRERKIKRERERELMITITGNAVLPN